MSAVRLLLAASLGLSGCVSASVYHAEGVTVARRAADLARCEARALERFPVRDQTRFRPPVYVPPRQSCDAAGTCTLIEGYFLPAEPYVVDANRAPRQTALAGCMGEDGYARIDLPFCERGQAVVPSTTLPPLTGGTCLLRRGPGEPLIVNPPR